MATKKKVTDVPVNNAETAEVTAPVQTEEVGKRNTTKYKTGIVSCRTKLRVREKASLDSNVLCEIESGATVKIDTANSTDEWYKVRTKDGVDGFCMKRYITIQ